MTERIRSLSSTSNEALTSHETSARETARVLNIVGEWIREQSTSVQTIYADAIGYPVSLTTGYLRDTSTLRRGLTWLRWCELSTVHPLAATRTDVHDWLANVETTSLSKRTRAHMLSTVSSFYTWCTEEGHIHISPVAVNRKKRGLAISRDVSPTRSLDRREVARLQHAADHDRIATQRPRSSAIVATLFTVGMRVSELTGLTLADIVLMQGKRALMLTLKGNRRHVVELPDSAARRVDQYLRTRPDLETRPALHGDVRAISSPPLFTTATGKSLQRSEVLRLLKRLAKQAGIENPGEIHPHTARHTWITTARQEGMDAGSIQKHVGHLDKTTTDRYGLHALIVASSVASTVARAYEEANQ